MNKALSVAALLAASFIVEPAAAQHAQTARLSVTDMFAVADGAHAAGDVATAERAYRALSVNPDIEVRTEARFRLAAMLERQGRREDAVALLRQILDEKNDAQRVRLELARMLAESGEEAEARRELRRVDRGELPPEVRQAVNQFADALRSRQPFGGSFSLALAPDANINRATKSDTLDTIIAPLELSEDAQAQSGVGLDIGLQGYARLPLTSRLNVLGRLSTQGDIYESAQFNDVRGAAQLGLEWFVGDNQFSPSLGRAYRWYGEELYSTTDTLSLDWRRGIGRAAQLSLNFGVGDADYRLNDLQDGWIYDASVRYERAFASGRWGVGVTLSGQRQDAADPGYATTSGGVELLGWRRFEHASAFTSINLRQLEADERLFLFPEKREDQLAVGMAGIAFPRFTIRGFAPLVRVSYERNWSTVELYDYDRVAGAFGFTRDF